MIQALLISSIILILLILEISRIRLMVRLRLSDKKQILQLHGQLQTIRRNISVICGMILPPMKHLCTMELVGVRLLALFRMKCGAKLIVNARYLPHSLNRHTTRVIFGLLEVPEIFSLVLLQEKTVSHMSKQTGQNRISILTILLLIL